MITRLLASIYGGIAMRRREWYAAHPDAVRRLTRPVVSVGNLRVGGTGKTPVVAAIAREAIARGFRPAILSRGYAREKPLDGTTVVSDGGAVLSTVETAGDEPLMLARQLPGVAVLVGSDRYLSGRLAESQLGATIHILDDGFQHFELARTVDLVVADAADLADEVLPAGRLREPLSAARRADALLVSDAAAGARKIADALGGREAFVVTRALGAVPEGPVLAVAGIARPERFFDDLAARGCRVADRLVFPDHHRFSPADVARIAGSARASGVRAIVTTEKDAVRLPAAAGGIAIVAVPLTASLEPRFGDWLMKRIA